MAAMKYKLAELVNVQKLNRLLQSLYRATEIPSGIIDVDGNILAAVGWQDICRLFHRQHPETQLICQHSDNYVKQSLASCQPYLLYRCPLGLMDAAAPIMIDGCHVATVFQGQFFFEPPDSAHFKAQAGQYGFDQDQYLEALGKAPIYTREKLDSIMHYFIELAEILADLGVARLRQMEIQEAELRRRDEQLFNIFNNTPNVAIQGYDAQGNITFWNHVSQQLYGFTAEEILGKPVTSILFEAAETTRATAILQELAASSMPIGPVEWKMKHKSGQERIVSSTMFSVQLSCGKQEFICMDVDVTERKKLEEEVKRLDRLHLVGEMAASLAHEIRNPMTTVRGYLQMLRKKPCFQRHIYQFDMMIAELDSANLIIKEFLCLAKNKSIERKTGDINQIIEALLPLLYAEALTGNKSIRWQPGLAKTMQMDDNEIRQLVIHLVRNALEAVGKGGTVQISTALAGQEFLLQVRDNGCGIPKELMERLGTPFVTTKEQGTGLGLAVCYSIAARHNAKINIQSGEDGTTVVVRFPIA